MSVQEQLLELFWEVLEGCDYEVEAIKRELSVDDDLAKKFMIDSLDMVEFYVRVQEHFAIVIPQDDYMRLDTIANIEGFLSDKLEQPAITS